jgi:hypothetical protein
VELGTGIFLASLVIGIVFLFHTTKDRWSWKNTPNWDESMLIAFNNKSSIARIRFSTNDATDCFHTVCGGDSLKEIRDKLGPFDSYTEGADGTMRWYKYKKLNTDFIVMRSKVKGFEIGRHTK